MLCSTVRGDDAMSRPICALNASAGIPAPGCRLADAVAVADLSRERSPAASGPCDRIPSTTHQFGSAERAMKGGKGGTGRSRSKTRVVEKTKPRGGAKKGATKRDWGAISRNDDDAPVSAPVETPRKPASAPPKAT